MCLPLISRHTTMSSPPTPDHNASTSTPRKMFNRAMTLLDPSTPRTKKPKPRADSPHRPPVTSKKEDDTTQTPYYHDQNAHDQYLLNSANSEDGRFRLKQREQRLVIKHGVCIRDFAFEPRPAEPEAEAEVEVKEENEFSRGRSDSTASPPMPGIFQSDSFCSLTPEQQQLVLDAWERGDAIPS